ncbi:MAG: hypothetical protein VX082_00010 [Pseudomonadota bacterium]|nr:hypothetical protein [Pseudomonadota bacterium]
MEDDPDPCFICKQRYKDAQKLLDGTWIYDCDRCGSYKCADTDVISAMDQCLKEDRPKFSGWVRGKNRLGYSPTLTIEALNNIVSKDIPVSPQRALYFIKEALVAAGGVGNPFHYRDPRYVGATFSQASEDLQPLLKYLSDLEYITKPTIGGPNAFAMVTVQGEEASLELTD